MRLGRVRWLSKKVGQDYVLCKGIFTKPRVNDFHISYSHSSFPILIGISVYSWIWLVNIEQLTPHLWAHTRMNLGQEYVTMELKWWCHTKHGYRGPMNIKEWTTYNRRLMEYVWGMREVHYIGGFPMIISIFTLIPRLAMFFNGKSYNGLYRHTRHYCTVYP